MTLPSSSTVRIFWAEGGEGKGREGKGRECMINERERAKRQ